MPLNLKNILIKNNRPTLGFRIAILSFASVILAVFIGGLVLVPHISNILEEEMGMRAMAIGRTLAQMDEIQQNIGKPEGKDIIHAIAEKTRLATGVEYIVVLDMQGIRYSHPVEERIGKKFTDKDLWPALANHEYTSRAHGVNGPSVRAFVPVKVDEGTRQIGVVVVGIITPTLAYLLKSIHTELTSSLLVGLIVGLVGSIFLATRIKRAMFSLEPEEIAHILQERTAMFQAMDEAVIAVNTDLIITIANEEAKRLLSTKDEIMGKHILQVIPNSKLPRVLKTGQPELNSQLWLTPNIQVITNRVPVRVNGQIVGAIATFRDRTEVDQLAEELTGVKAFVEALRVQNHEYLNKMHTIAGLIHLQKYQQAIDYIFEITEEQREVTQLISKKIKDNRVVGLLLGKYARAKELMIELIIDRNSSLEKTPYQLSSSALVVIIGNLIENALEATRSAPENLRRVLFSISDQEDLEILVRDWGPGIPEESRSLVFEKGFTTKKSSSNGLGLYLVKKEVETAGGTIKLDCPETGGTLIKVHIPKGDNH